jgi:DNA-binding response OmpR family regulator
MRILIIDDDAAVRASIKIVLRSKGFDVVEAGDGEAGLEKAKDTSISLMMIDLFMPGLNGFKTMQALRQQLPSVPIIAMSGSVSRGETGTPEEFETASELGAHAVMHKPFRPEELLAVVNKALGL